MKWFAITSFIIATLGLFLLNKYRLERRIKLEGGMSKKYETLIKILMDPFPRSQIFKETSSYISFGASSFGTVTLFDIVLTFKTITVTYNVQSMIFGNYKLRWDFSVNEDQEFMAYKINKDIGTYLSEDKKVSKFISMFNDANHQ